MRSSIRCCKDCTDRKVGCHSECEKFKKEREAYLKEKAKYTQDVVASVAIRDGGVRMRKER